MCLALNYLVYFLNMFLTCRSTKNSKVLTQLKLIYNNNNKNVSVDMILITARTTKLWKREREKKPFI